MKKFQIIVIVGLAVLMSAPVWAAPKLHKTQELTYNLNAEPQTVDPARSTGIIEMNVELSCFEGLTRLGPNDRPVPGVAEKWNVSKDNLVYTFNLRKNAKWSNGDPVTAHDFEYAWKRALDPKIAASYAYQLYPVKNAEAYNTKQLTDPNQVGVKALDDYTLQVTLEAPCPYFISICYFPALNPVHRKTVEANPEKWAVNPATYIGNGPFKMVKWVHNERIEFAPNPHYWNRQVVKLTKLTFLLIEEQSTSLTMYESGQADFIDDNGIPRPEIPRLQAEGSLKFVPYLGTYYYMFNTKNAPVNNAKVRKALNLAIERDKIAKYITKAGEMPATAFVPDGIPDAAAGKTFRQVGGAFFKDGDLQTAKKLLAEAGYPDGKGFPEIEILYNTHEMHKQIAEAIQEMWKKNLGVNVTITNQEWKVYLVTRKQLAYHSVVRAGWIGDYVDPMTFMDLFVTNGGNNHTGWSNPQYDKLIDTAKNSGDQKIRMKAMHDAEKILMDEMPLTPIYFYTRPYLMKSWVKGVKQSALGMNDFSQAYLEQH